MRNQGMAKKLCSKIGSLLAIDSSLDTGRWTRFLRIRVQMDITKPLRREIRIGPSEGNKAI
ncbi:hypothetical protein REPUB_Repub08aG0114000 [Reevesia pubescens]